MGGLLQAFEGEFWIALVDIYFGQTPETARVFGIEAQRPGHGFARLFQLTLGFVTFAQDSKTGDVVRKTLTAFLAQREGLVDFTLAKIKIGQTREERHVGILAMGLFQFCQFSGHHLTGS
jgi:hypothetical protein